MGPLYGIKAELQPPEVNENAKIGQNLACKFYTPIRKDSWQNP